MWYPKRMDKFRPDLTEYVGAINAIKARLNETAAYSMNSTDICKIALERLYKAAFPGSELPVPKRKKMYIPLIRELAGLVEGVA